MIKVKFEYDDGISCKTAYSKECNDDCLEFEGELGMLNGLYLEFLMACGFPFTYKDEVIVVEEGDIETIELGIDLCDKCGYRMSEEDDYTCDEFESMIAGLYSTIE